MKTINLLTSCAVIILLTACGKPTEIKDPKIRLAELKNQLKDLNAQIKELEILVAANDTSFSFSKSKLVKIDTPQKRDFKHYIEVQGIVDANNNILAAPQMPGVVTSILVKEGDLVSPGKILAVLDGATIRKGMDEVKTGLSLANTMYEKQKRLWEQNIGSEAQYLQAKNQKDQLELKLKTLESQLAMTYIKSPIQGTVDQVNLKIGEIASPGFAGVRVVNNKI
ncbi:MAG: biotin/lipoyl-binding protein [Saprospiraceae bacterium]|nr:biotin/lipoyl-binding protein [Saprospiraceae bacterium]